MNSRFRKAFSLILFLFIFAGQAYCLEVDDLLGIIDWSGTDLKVIGVCGVGGLIVMYWEPALLIETVKRPGDTVIEPLRPVISKAAEQAVNNFAGRVAGLSVPVSSGSTSDKASQSNLQFNEVHVYEFPFRDEVMLFMGMVCPDKIPTGMFVKYLSELDSLEWRIGILEAINPKSLVSVASGPVCAATGGFMDDLCMGFWGPTYPRRGFFTHQSEVVASAAAAVRAVSIAGLLGSSGHIVLEGIGFMPSFESDKLELIYPKPSGFIRIGQNPLTWESGKLSSSGNYLWVYWRRRICCVY